MLRRALSHCREIFLVIIHVENGLCRVYDPPHDGNANLHRITQAVVDFLPVIVQGHDFQGDFLLTVSKPALAEPALSTMEDLAWPSTSPL